jgi:hypothetical protein
MCADVFTIENDVNLMFNNFLNACLIIFNHSFCYKKHSSKQYNKIWITKGIRISCGRKRELYMLSRNTDNPVIRAKSCSVNGFLNRKEQYGRSSVKPGKWHQLLFFFFMNWML